MLAAVAVGAELSAGHEVHAQAARIDTIVVGPGGLCLDVQRNGAAVGPAPLGTPLLLRTCDGSEDQRWSMCVGDCGGELYGPGRTCIAARGAQLVIADCAEVPIAPRLLLGALRVHPGDRCATAHAAAPGVAHLTAEPCRAGDPAQAFPLPR